MIEGVMLAAIVPQLVKDAQRVNAQLATVKSTPGHAWCATCGANKPEHRHEKPNSYEPVKRAGNG